MMRYLVLPVVGLLFLLQVVTAMLARSPRGLWRAVWGSALGLDPGVGVRGADRRAAADRRPVLRLPARRRAGRGAGRHQEGLRDGRRDRGLRLAGRHRHRRRWGSSPGATIIVVLFLRKAMIIGTVVFGPFAMAGLASGKTKSWAVKWVEVVFALALSKFVICAILTLAYSAVGVLGHRGHHRRLARVGVGAARRVLPAGGAAVRALRRRPDHRREHLRRGRRAGQRDRQAGRPGHGGRRQPSAASWAGPPGGSPAEPAASTEAHPDRPRPRRSAATAARPRGSGTGRKPHQRQRVRARAAHHGGCRPAGQRRRGQRRPGRRTPVRLAPGPHRRRRSGRPAPRRRHRIARCSPRWTPTSTEAGADTGPPWSPRPRRPPTLAVPQTQADRMFLHVRDPGACSVRNSPAVPAGSIAAPSTTGGARA